MAKGTGKTGPGKSQISFVMTADDAERYAPPAEIDTDAVLQEKGRHGKEEDPKKARGAGKGGELGRR